jgi:hypothetical protein
VSEKVNTLILFVPAAIAGKTAFDTFPVVPSGSVSETVVTVGLLDEPFAAVHAPVAEVKSLEFGEKLVTINCPCRFVRKPLAVTGPTPALVAGVLPIPLVAVTVTDSVAPTFPVTGT